MRITPEPPEFHKLMSPRDQRIADGMWEGIHLFSYTLVMAAILLIGIAGAAIIMELN